MAATIWYEKDADLSVFDGKKVAILGYGSQGHAHALNLRDSGVDVVVGLRPTSKSVEFAKEQGLEVKPVGEAVAEADVVMILLPDQYQAAVYKKDVEPNLKPGAALAFAHGFNIHYGYIKPSEDHPVFMVAPKGPGHIVRREYAAGRGVPVVVAVEQDPDGKTWPLCLAYAKALGAPEGFRITVRELKVSAGAHFVVALTGSVLPMPGLPKVPAAENIDVDNDGNITGLF